MKEYINNMTEKEKKIFIDFISRTIEELSNDAKNTITSTDINKQQLDKIINMALKEEELYIKSKEKYFSLMTEKDFSLMTEKSKKKNR